MKITLSKRRFMLYFLIMAMMPFLRACEKVTYGFPLVSIEGSSLYAWDKIYIENIILNLAIMFLLAKLFLLKYEKDNFTGISIRGVKSVLVYHYFIIFGFAVIYNLFAIRFIAPVPDILILNIQMLYAYFVYPVEPLIRYTLLFNSPDRTSEVNNILMYEGTVKDISIRAAYVLMIIIWYLAGYVLERQANKNRTD